MLRRGLQALVLSSTMAWLLLITVTAVVVYAYASFDITKILLTAQYIKPFFDMLGLQGADYLALASAYTLNGGVLADIGAFLHGMPVSRDFSSVFWYGLLLNQV